MTAASETSSLSFATSIPITRVASFERVILSHHGEYELVGCHRALKRRFGFKNNGHTITLIRGVEAPRGKINLYGRLIPAADRNQTPIHRRSHSNLI